jgi:hypothetical protein
VKNIVYLIPLWIIIDRPVENVFIEFPYFDLTIFGNVLIVLITILVAFHFLKYRLFDFNECTVNLIAARTKKEAR